MCRYLAVLFVFVLTSCDSNLCGNTVLNELSSPRNEYIASVFERNCGATSPFVTVVSIRPYDNKFDSETFDDWVFTVHGESQVEVLWLDKNNLRIKYSTSDKEPTKRKEWDDVKISYM